MTTIVAVKKHGRTCIVSDSQTTYGARKETRENLIVNSSKLFFWENAIIGFSGSSTWKHAFLDFLHLQKTPAQRIKGSLQLLPSSPETVLSSFSKLWRSFRSHYLLTPVSDKNSQYFSCCRILVATRQNIFKLTIEGGVVCNENMAAIGSGLPFAYGAMRAVDGFIESPLELARYCFLMMVLQKSLYNQCGLSHTGRLRS